MDVNWRKVFWPTNGEEARQRIADYLQKVGGGKTAVGAVKQLPGTSCAA